MEQCAKATRQKKWTIEIKNDTSLQFLIKRLQIGDESIVVSDSPVEISSSKGKNPLEKGYIRFADIDPERLVTIEIAALQEGKKPGKSFVFNFPPNEKRKKIFVKIDRKSTINEIILKPQQGAGRGIFGKSQSGEPLTHNITKTAIVSF